MGKTGKGELPDYRAKVRGRCGGEGRRAGGRWECLVDRKGSGQQESRHDVVKEVERVGPGVDDRSGVNENILTNSSLT